MGDIHGPNKLTNYLETHDTVMNQFKSRGFVLVDGLTLSAMGNGVMLMSGLIECAGDIMLTVTKHLQVVDGEGDNVRVKNVGYSYQGWLRGHGNIVRYDSPHENHNRCHHVHRADCFTPGADETLEEIPDGQWPTLGEVLHELEKWYYENYERLNHGHT